jgi:hypothetical protein
MPTNTLPHSQQNIYQNQNKTKEEHKTHGGVWQDNNGGGRGRADSGEPVIVANTPRTRGSNTLLPRSQKHSTSRKTVQVASWVDEPIRAQLAELARSQNLSMSQTIHDLLKEILRQKFHQQQAATLPSIIEKAVAKSNRSLATRLAWLLVRIAFDTGQTRVLATNILGMQEGMTEENLKDILQTADKRTKANLTRKTPQLTELMEAVEKWLLEGEEEGSKN